MALERKGRRGVRRGELTPSEIEATAADADAGGFSRRMTGPGVGRPARNVFSTGFAPDAGRAEEVPIDPSASSAGQIGQYIKNKASTWAVRGADWILGGWTEGGRVNLDTSVATPRTTGGLEAALQMGTYGDQAATGNLGYKGYLGDVDIPSHLSRTQFYESRGTVAPANEGIEPKVSTTAGNTYVDPTTGQMKPRKRVVIEPSRKEMVQVEAQEMSKKMGLKDK